MFAESVAKKNDFITYFGSSDTRRGMKVRVNGKYWPENTVMKYLPHMENYMKNLGEAGERHALRSVGRSCSRRT